MIPVKPQPRHVLTFGHKFCRVMGRPALECCHPASSRQRLRSISVQTSDDVHSQLDESHPLFLPFQGLASDRVSKLEGGANNTGRERLSDGEEMGLSAWDRPLHAAAEEFWVISSGEPFRLGIGVSTTEMATERGRNGEGSECMDARLWGELQSHIDLVMVYVKLPIGDFFRLCLVCKEWNRLASDRGFLEDTFREPIPKPYFVLGNWKMKHRLVTYDGSSQRWSATRIPPALCEVEGVFREEFYSNRIFNVHTRVFYDPPPPPKPPSSLPSSDEDDEDDEDEDDDAVGSIWTQESLLGMTVDTSVWPYSFRMILGDELCETRIYDSTSNSWTLGHSWLSEEYEESPRKLSCAQCGDLLYINIWGLPGGTGADFHVYDLKNDAWDLGPPYPGDLWCFGDIGAWQDRLFFFGVEKLELGCAVSVLELCGHSEKVWMPFDSMPVDMCTWVMAGQEEKMIDSMLGIVEIQSIFCGEYVLVHNCVGLEELTERAVLYNLDRKTWETVELPGPRCVLWSEADDGLTIGLRNSILSGYTIHMRASHESSSEVP